MGDCIFCDIAAGAAPAHCVYDDGTVFAILSLEQPTPYKLLVIPHAHVENLFDLDDELAASIFKATVKIARSVRDVSGCPGLNLVQSNGTVGQQDVFHFHLHIVPRFEGDGILLDWDNSHASQDKLAQFAGEIRIGLQSNHE
ncbi:MAG: HIT family protein [Anaerolineaceae bacterium]|nr:HIT family protein [Anaerolineaceae bacterium]